MTDSAAVSRPSQYVGSRVMRSEDPRFLTGKGTYVDDIHLPGMLHAAFVRSPFPHARIASIDATAARELSGVRLVLTGAELAERTDPVITVEGTGLEGVAWVPRRILAVDKTRFVGEAVAMVVADSRYLAEDAVDLVEIEWDPLPAVVDPEKAIQPGAPTIHDEVPDNNIGEKTGGNGDVEAIFAAAPHVFSRRLLCGRHQAAPLEARGSVAVWDHGQGRGTLWSSNQMPHLIRAMMTIPLRISESELRVIAPDVGGGFGNKSNLFMEDMAGLYAARMLGKPVKWTEDRNENLAASTHGKETVCDLEAAFDDDGRILAMRGRFVGNVGAYTVPGPWAMVDSIPAATILPGAYDVPAVRWSAIGALTNKCKTAAYRGVGMSNGQAVRELLVDEAARALQIDPLELRLRNVIPPEPGYVTATGSRYDGGSYEASLRRAAELIDYPALRERQARLRSEGRYLGIGLSPFVEPTGFGSAVSAAIGLPAPYFDLATMTVQPDGSVTVRVGGMQNHGQGHETTFAQVAADAVGVELSAVRVIEGDTEGAPFGMGTYASRSAVVAGGMIDRAGRDLRAKLIEVAAHMLEASPADVELSDGVARLAGVPGVELSVAQIAGFAHFGGPARPELEEPALVATRSYDPPETYANGCIAAIVEIDPETGLVDLQDVVAVEDCGTVINPLVVDGQVAGAIAQGIGSALLEEVVYDEEGQLLTGSLLDYLYPSTMEVPEIRIEHIETPSDVSERGIKGVGEGGTVAAPAAVLNAIADALSDFPGRIERMPVRPDEVLAIIDGGEEG